MALFMAMSSSSGSSVTMLPTGTVLSTEIALISTSSGCSGTALVGVQQKTV
jgi:hypothetical protein